MTLYISVIQVLITLLFLSFGIHCQVWHLTPLSNDPCSVKHCFTLSQFVTNASSFFQQYNDITLVFQPGSHVLDSEITFSDLFSLKLENSNLSQSTKIICKRPSMLRFNGILTLHISNLDFTGCGGSIAQAIGQLSITGASFNGEGSQGTALELFEVRGIIEGSTFQFNVFGNLRNVIVENNYWMREKQLSRVGGAVIVERSNVTIIGNWFKRNAAEVGGALFCGLESNVKIINTVFMWNSANSSNGGALFFQGATLKIRECQFLNNTAAADGGSIYARESIVNISLSTFNGNRAQREGGVLSTSGVTLDISTSKFNDNAANHHGGTISATNGRVIINNCGFAHNQVRFLGGAVFTINCSLLNFNGSEFKSNKAKSGGVAYDRMSSIVNIAGSSFLNNHALTENGGAITLWSETVAINMSGFRNNNAYYNGGAIFVNVSTISITWNVFTKNRAEYSGGAVYVSYGSSIYIAQNRFVSNTAKLDGGAMAITNTDIRVFKIKVYYTVFSDNLADQNGGAINIDSNSIVAAVVHGLVFSNNEAVTGYGGAIYAQKIAITVSSVVINDNKANTGVVYLSQSAAVFINFVTLCNNTAGPIFLFSSNLTTAESSKVRIDNNNLLQNNQSLKASLQQGGAVTAVQSNLVLLGATILEANNAENGGAIHATESKVLVYGELIIAYNMATESGGGLHLYQSELNCKLNSILKIIKNIAVLKGGGVHTISSVISSEVTDYTASSVLIGGNTANLGGGVNLEVNSKIYILKLQYYFHSSVWEKKWNHHTFVFSANSADYGGAVYVTDNTNFATCSSTSYRQYSTLTECFVQTVTLRGKLKATAVLLDNFNFKENYAISTGSNLFGGLLDRCTVSPYAEVYHSYNESLQQLMPNLINGITYIKTVSTINDSDTISSHPVQICFCIDSKPRCDTQQNLINTKKGKQFILSVVAIDQVSHTVNATIRSSLSSILGGLGEDQSSQNITISCTTLNFSIFSPHSSETLILYAEGPCKDAKLSQRQVDIQFLPCTCPVGFQQNKAEDTKCVCECDDLLRKIISECHEQNNTLVRQGTFWITNLNTSDAPSLNRYYYLIYLHCPLDYCHPPTKRVYIDLSKENGADEQCNYNRSGTLCGRCRQGFSLSLGTSRCVPCPKHWPGMCVLILTVTLLAGIALVAILLMLNLTVATGTINGIIFYTNVVNANARTFFPFTEPNYITVFVSWLNLEFGIDLCFFEGMDTYWKTLLQLAFPVYVMILVVFVIFVSERSTKFARLIGRKNPVATLATLVLLSYTKLIHTIIAGLSFSILDYPNGSTQVVWLPDGSLGYLKGRHFFLFLLSLGILFAGIFYTALLFSWQWLIYYKHKKFLKWVRYNKLYLFLEPYHAPYTVQHRYWTGLLLVVRVILYLASALNISRDPAIDLLVTGVVLTVLFLIKAQLHGIVSSIYRKLAIDILETLCYMNIILFSLASLYALNSKGAQGQRILAYISGTVTLVLFLTVIIYHICFELCPFTKIWKKLRKRERIDDGVLLEDYQEADIMLREKLNPTVTWVDAPSNEEEPLSAQIKVELHEEHQSNENL